MKRSCLKNALVAALVLLLGSQAANAAGTVRTVTNTSDSGDGSLRAALAGSGAISGSGARSSTPSVSTRTEGRYHCSGFENLLRL